MDLLYKEYFGFTQGPFDITADPEFLYLSRSHREALAQLSYGIKGRRGFVVLTGEVGTGKTTLIHTLMNELEGHTRTALIFSHISNSLDLLRYICDEFGLEVPAHARNDLYDRLALLNQYLLDQYRLGINCALIIDEAQNLSSEVLESVRLLSNFETSKDKLLQILLVGQPELSARLNSQELRQLKQRVTLRHHLRPLTLKETGEYIFNRLRVASGSPNLFQPRAVEFIHGCAGGIPRLVNVICDNALLTAYSLGKKYIDDAIIRQVVEDLSMAATAAPQGDAGPAKNGLPSNFHDSPPAEVPGESKVFGRQRSPLSPSRSRTDTAFIVPRACLDELCALLLEAMGPMAAVVLSDRAAVLGETLDHFPDDKLDALVHAVSDEILDQSMKQDFQRLARQRLRTFGLLLHQGPPE